MKKNLFLSIIGLLLFSNASIAQIRTIEHPEYESSNTSSLEINKLEIKNAETVLYCDGFGRPNSWIALTSKSYLKGKSGKIYKFIRSEGFMAAPSPRPWPLSACTDALRRSSGAPTRCARDPCRRTSGR